MMNPQQEAIGRLQQAPAQNQQPAPAQAPQAPGANAGGQPGQPGGKQQAPAVTAINLLNAVASRMGMMGHKAEADKLAQVVGQVQAVIEEIKQSVQGGGQPQPGQPAPGQPGQMRGTPQEGQNRGTPAQGTGVPPVQQFHTTNVLN